MNIFFDMDYTLLGLDGTLRPNSREVMQRLKDDGHMIYVWSGNGIRWPEVRKFGLETLVTDCFVKPLEDLLDSVEKMKVPVTPDFVIDDYQEVPAALGGVWVSPYVYNNGSDDEMEHVYRIITEYMMTGHSEDRRFQASQNQP